MEYTKRKRYTVKQEDSKLREMYPHDMQFYRNPPTGNLTLKEFQDLGIERRQVLQLVESTMQRTDFKNIDERKMALLNLLKKDGLNYSAKVLNGQGCASHTDMELQARKRDHISHFILRLAYCQNIELRRWFLAMEVEYLKLRFSSLNKEGIVKLLSLNDFGYTPISQEEKDNLREYLYSATAKIPSVDNTDFYKVPFQQVSDLVRKRRVYVSRGIAYIPQTELVTLFISQFKAFLTEELENSLETFKMLEDDDRLSSYLKNLPNIFAGMTKTVWSTVAVPIEKLDELSKISYPLCMRTLHDALRAEHHLKNGGRMQYGLFIKGIGVSLEDALRFWRNEFTKKIDLEVFEKKYSYDIKHYFGKLGKQTNYTPYGCQKIITGGLGAGDNHGCPFKHMSSDNLKQKLTNYGFPASGISEAVKLAKEGHYLLACTKCFEVTHKSLPERPFVHPNSYYQQSRDIIMKSVGASSTQTAQSNNGHIDNTLPRTPSQKAATPSRNSYTPMRTVGTPTASRTMGTPLIAKKLTSKMDEVNIEEMLNDDEIDEMMAEM